MKKIVSIIFILWIIITSNLTAAIISSVAVLVIACPCVPELGNDLEN